MSTDSLTVAEQSAEADELEQFRKAFRSTLRSFLEKQFADSLDPYSREVQSDEVIKSWQELSGQIGVAGVLIPEEHGGLGLTLVDADVLTGECARALFGGPVLSTAVLAPLLLQWIGYSDEVEKLLPAISSGSMIVAVAVEEASDRSTSAIRVHDGWQLNGSKSPVIDGALAETLLVVVENGDSSFKLFAVSAANPTVSVKEFEGLDRTRRLAEITFNSAPAMLIGEGTHAHLTLLNDVAAVMVASEAAAVAEECLEIAVNYAKIRKQFGKPIGSFQAVKHLCAELFIQVESQRATVQKCVEEVERAVLQVNNGTDAITNTSSTTSESASLAKAYVCSSATDVAETMIQILGGIGFTWEHTAHRYLRRAKSLEILFGTPQQHRRRIAVLQGARF